MRTYPVCDDEGRHVAFEIEHVYLSRSALAELLRTVCGVADVALAGRFGGTNDVRIRFKYRGNNQVVWEPYGDSSRYYIGPKDSSDAVDISALEALLRSYRPPVWREILGWLLRFRSSRH